MPWMSRLGLAGLLLLVFLAIPPPVGASDQIRGGTSAPLLRISTENALDHVQTRAIQRFISLVRQRAGDRIVIELHPEARLYRDRDVIRALERGQVEMAVPGIWQFDRFAPDAGLFFLPLVYGREMAQVDRLRDGEIGLTLNRRIEAAIGAKVLGRWIDLGFAHLFTLKKPVRTVRDMSGLTIRMPGGEASAHRLAAQGANPVSIAWPDLPTALAGNKLDGLVTTFETAASARLWELGIRHAFEDGAYFAQYVPLVSAHFWNRLSPELRNILAEAWEDGVLPSRQSALQAQQQARMLLTENGVVIVTPSREELVKARDRLEAGQESAVRALGIDPALVENAKRLLSEKP